jgi:hypothetical protein
MGRGSREAGLRWTRLSYLSRFSATDDQRAAALRGCHRNPHRVWSPATLGHLNELALALGRLRAAGDELLQVLSQSEK